MYTAAKLAGCLFLLLISSYSFSQQILTQTKIAGNGVSAAEGCLGCPGSEWNDANKITKKDGSFASTSLAEEGFCFQSICYYSRGLIASQFGFAIDPNAEIKGIKVAVVRKAEKGHSVKDYNIQLMKKGLLVGDNKSAPGFWPITSSSKSYGGNSDLWGTSWTASEINDPSFGFFLQCQNGLDNPVEAYVDVVKIAIYYVLQSPKLLSTTNGALTDLKVYPNPVSQSAMITFSASEKGQAEMILLDKMGREMLTMDLEISEGLFSKQIDLSAFPSGIYFIRCSLNNEILIKKIVKE
jgi:hypothetical protein